MKIVKILFITCGILLFNCKNSKQIKTKIQKENNMNTSEILYYLDYELFGSYEIYLNDVKIANNLESGSVSGMEYLNHYILKSGIQVLRIREFFVNVNSNIPEDLVKKVNLNIEVSS